MPQQHATAAATGVLAITVVMALAGWAGLRPVAAQEEDRLTIALNEYQGSGVSGTATLTAAGEGVQVSMELAGDVLTGGHPTHIHTGTCDDFDPDPTFPLTTVILDEVSDEGVSATAVDAVSLDALLADDYVILVHLSPEELTTYFVCGDIKPSNAVATADADADADADAAPAAEAGAAATAAPTASDPGAGGIVHPPQTGVGTTADGDGSRPTTLLALLTAIFAASLGALLLRRRSHS